MSRWAIFPILIAIHPILAVFAAAGKWQPLEDYTRFAAISLTIVVVAWLVLSVVLSHSGKAAFAIAAFWFLLFNYANVTDLLRPYGFWPECAIFIACIGIAILGWSRSRSNGKKTEWYAALGVMAAAGGFAFLFKPALDESHVLAVLWLTLCLAAACWTATVRATDKLIPYLNIAAIGLVALPAYDMYRLCTEAAKYNASHQPHKVQLGKKPLNPQPDIYHIVLDGYGRADALQRDFGFDNKPFIRALEARGFFVATRARANYAQTEKSLSSILNAESIDKLAPQVEDDSKIRSLFVPLIRDNAVSRALEEKGYEYITVSTGFSPFNRDSETEYLSDPSGMSLAEQLMIYQTPAKASDTLSDHLHQAHRDLINSAFDAVASQPDKGKPKYVLAHILSPHPPFVFDKNGKPVNPERAFGIWDSDLFTEVIGSKPEYTVGYPQQLQYVNARLLYAIDQIVKHSKTKPVIILQGDHGPRRDHSMTTLEKTEPSHSYPNLVAVLAPAPVRKNLYNDITNVNVTRAVLAGLFGGKFEKLPDRTYYSTWAKPYENVDITDAVNGKP